MNTTLRSAALLSALALPLLAACQKAPEPPAPPAPPAAQDTTGASSRTFIGRQVEKALAEARKELETSNIDIGDAINININGHKVHAHDSNLPKAQITPQGDLLIDGKPVTVSPEQRRQLLVYRSQIVAVAQAGMEIGSQGADLAGEALSGVAGAIFGGEEGTREFEQRMEAEGRKIEAEAMKLCALLPPMLATQQQLAASLPAFKPYARMTQEDIDDCGKEGNMSDAERAHVREEIRNGIRESIRGSVRGTVQAATNAEAAQAADTTAKPATSGH